LGRVPLADYGVFEELHGVRGAYCQFGRTVGVAQGASIFKRSGLHLLCRALATHHQAYMLGSSTFYLFVSTVYTILPCTKQSRLQAVLPVHRCGAPRRPQSAHHRKPSRKRPVISRAVSSSSSSSSPPTSSQAARDDSMLVASSAFSMRDTYPSSVRLMENAENSSLTVVDVTIRALWHDRVDAVSISEIWQKNPPCTTIKRGPEIVVRCRMFVQSLVDGIAQLRGPVIANRHL
jgi:hypothetical protein